MSDEITKEEALALVLKRAWETDYPIDLCYDYGDAWSFERSTAPACIGGPTMPVTISKATGTINFDFSSFIMLRDKPSRVYTIASDGTFTEAPLSDYWDDEDEDDEGYGIDVLTPYPEDLEPVSD